MKKHKESINLVNSSKKIASNNSLQQNYTKAEDFAKIIPLTITQSLSNVKNIRKPIFLGADTHHNKIEYNDLITSKNFPIWPDEEKVKEFNEEALNKFKALIDQLESKFSKFINFTNEIRKFHNKELTTSLELRNDPFKKYFKFKYSFLFLVMAIPDYFENKFYDKSEDLFLPLSIKNYFVNIKWLRPEQYVLKGRVITKIIATNYDYINKKPLFITPEIMPSNTSPTCF